MTFYVFLLSVLGLSVLCGTVTPSAQAPASMVLTAEISPSRAPVGQVIELRLAATWNATVDHVTPRFDTWSGPFEVVDIDTGAPQQTNERGSQVWLIRLRTFDVGRVVMPGLAVDFQQAGTLSRLSAQTGDLVVDSVAPPVEGDAVRPIRDVVDPQRDLADYAAAAAIGALTVLAAVHLAVWLAARLRRARNQPRAFNARTALRRLRRQHGRRPADVESLYSDISTTTRRFLETRFDIPGPVLSSTEIVAALRATKRAGEPVERLSEMLSAVDAVRFGGRIPTAAETEHVLQLTQSLLLDRGFLAAMPPAVNPAAVPPA